MSVWDTDLNEILGITCESSNENDDPLLKTGLTYLQVLRKALIPSAAVVGTAVSHVPGPHCAKSGECNCRPSELPIYPGECSACNTRVIERKPTELETAVGKVRREIWIIGDGISGYKKQVVDYVDTGIAHSSSSIDFLREESNGPERIGAIAISTLSGFIFGLRGGIFKRLTYATAGGLSMAALCYPRDASEYLDQAVQEGNRYFIAGYHFVFGETPKMPEWAENMIGKAEKKIKESVEKK